MSLPTASRIQLTSCFKRRRICDGRELVEIVKGSAGRRFTNASFAQICSEESHIESNLGCGKVSTGNHDRPQRHWKQATYRTDIQHLSTRAWPRPGFVHLPVKHSWPRSTEPEPQAHFGPSPIRWLSTTRHTEFSLKSQGNMHRAVVAFGSNIGDRITYIENALASLRSNGLRILKLSRLYETAPMYYANQDSFLNGVVLIETDLSPIALLDLLQQIETEQGRRRDIEKGPRTLDLDIILYGDELIDVDRLKVPHPGILEREFVLRPLSDVIPNHVFKPLGTASRSNGIVEIRSALSAITDPTTPMFPITHLKPTFASLMPTNPHRRTNVMSILNITPDSFSDGGNLSPTNLDVVTQAVQSHISSGATILDIGGQSTRPNAPFLSASEELTRVLPVLRQIKQMSEATNVAISLDTFHSEVARACASEDLIDIINDISAGQMDSKMLHVMAESRKTVVLMHTRGTPSTMNILTDYPDGVVKGVAQELSQRVTEALEAGIPPWRIILDPGIGFAKTLEQNLELLRAGTDELVRERPDVLAGYPWLVGTSRKGFIGRITGVKEASERIWGTASCVVAAIDGGADIVRVHDVREMGEVVKMADAIYRGSYEGTAH